MRAGILILFFFVPAFLFSQEKQDGPGEYKIFYHENGKISSEGYMVDGKPDGYWKTYNENGILIAEGNREDFKLDSLWKFYNDDGSLKLEVNYREGKKHGIRTTYRKDEIIRETFKNDIKDGPTKYFYKNGELKKEVFFVNGLEEGMAREYAEDGRAITLITYKNGFITDIQKINRFIGSSKKHGPWKYWYDNGVVRLEGSYKRGLEHGYFKEYDREGNLLTATKYENGQKVEDAREVAKLEVRKDYYPDGTPKIVATYNKEGEPEGIRREYAEDGTIERSYIFKNGIIIGEGIITEKGERDGYWKEYYDDGKLYAEGKYEKDVRVGPWKFYHKNGNLRQEGAYNSQGKPEGEWLWYYENGKILREENYYLGLLDGLMAEYSEQGKLIAQGDFIEGLEEGDWFYEVGDVRIEGSYAEGKRTGTWKIWQLKGLGKERTLIFEGRFIEDNPHGKHTYYWDNGNKRDEGQYLMGLKVGDWVSYTYEGLPSIVITYEQGREIKYDGIRIQTPSD